MEGPLTGRAVAPGIRRRAGGKRERRKSAAKYPRRARTLHGIPSPGTGTTRVPWPRVPGQSQAPPARVLVLQVSQPGSLGGHPPSLGLDPRRAPEQSNGQGRKVRVGWTPPRDHYSPKPIAGITSPPRRHPAPQPGAVRPPTDPPRGAQSRPELRSRAPLPQPEPGAPGEAKPIHRPKSRRRFPTRRSKAPARAFHPPRPPQSKPQAHPQSQGSPHSGTGGGPGTVQLPKAKLETKVEPFGGGTCGEPGPSLARWRRGRGTGSGVGALSRCGMACSGVSHG